MTKISAFLLGSVTAGAAFAGWLWWTDAERGQAIASTPARVTDTSLLVRTATIEARLAARELLLTGSLVAREEVMVAPELPGLRYIAVPVEEGDRVEAGQVLARLDTAVLRTQLAQVEAQLERARAAILQGEAQLREATALAREADANFRRADAIRASGAVSVEQLDQRRAQAAAATARVAAAEQGTQLARADRAAAEAQRQELITRIAKAELTAPTAGIVLRRSARLGAASDGEAAFVILRDGLIELDAEVSETTLASLVPGMPVRVVVAGATTVLGSIRLVAPTVDSVARQGRVRVALAAEPSLKPGMFARGTVDLAALPALLVPESALRFEGPNSFVYRLDGEHARRVPVITGIRRGGLVEVRGAIEAGERVVLGAGAFLRDGDRVRIAEGAAQ
ncbi:MAG: efflux RND transporter periplasmic adaptor subunit [Alphaproteobacteria bacterium]|nr:efflux RND transporter periplasmic adaptor subunit [Alphaproteobacteria bacterium]